MPQLSPLIWSASSFLLLLVILVVLGVSDWSEGGLTTHTIKVKSSENLEW